MGEVEKLLDVSIVTEADREAPNPDRATAQREIAENLSEEELASLDILIKPELTLTKQQEAEVKKVARTFLATLKREKLVLDWRKRQQSRQAVRLAIEEILAGLPLAYTTELYQKKYELAYRHIYDSYFGEGRSIYAMAS